MKRLLSVLLSIALMMTTIPFVSAAESGVGFMQEVELALPEAQTKGLMVGGAVLPDPNGSGFIKELSGTMPVVREDGFLVEPSAPLKEFPAAGKLIEAVGAPAEDAQAVGNAEQLAAMKPGGSYYLTADIDLTGQAWTPLNFKKGSLTLDGQGHAIIGLDVSGVAGKAGLLSEVAGLTVRNLIIKNFTVKDFLNKSSSECSSVGALAGYVSKWLTLENCVVENASLSGEAAYKLHTTYIGGLVGQASLYNSGTATLRSCAVSGQVALDTVNTPGKYLVGGLVSYITTYNAEGDITVTDCLSKIQIEGPDGSNYGRPSAYGGLVGKVSGENRVELLRCVMSGMVSGANGYGLIMVSGSDEVEFRDCVFNGTIDGEGGLAQSISCGSLSLVNCRTAGSVTSNKGYAGGLIGDVDVTNDLTVQYCLTECAVTAKLYQHATRGVGGFIGTVSAAEYLFSDCMAGEKGAVTDETATEAGGFVGDSQSDEATWLRCVNYGTITGRTETGGLVGENTTWDGQIVVFQDCVNYGSVDGTTAGGLMGSGGCTAANCVNTGTIQGTSAGGFLGDMGGMDETDDPLEFKDCRVSCTLVAAGQLGGLVANGDSFAFAVSNCPVKLNAQGSGFFGGLLGLGSGEIERCQVEITAEEHSASNLGGLIGSAEGTVNIWDCLTRLDIAVQSAVNVGGLIAYMENKDTLSHISNCGAQVEVASKEAEFDQSVSFGGLVCRAQNLVLDQCYATGEAKVTSVCGGLVGDGSFTMGRCYSGVDLSGTTVGGLAAGSNGIIYSSWSDGTLTLSKDGGCVGGLFGSGSLVMQDCCFRGTIIGALGTYVGGLAGFVSGTLLNCYFNGTLTNGYRGSIGGLVGYLVGTARSCQFQGTVSGQNCQAGGIAGECNGIIEDCKVYGSISGSGTGGIVGWMEGDVNSCVVDATVHPGAHKGFTVGGIVATTYGGNITNCRMEKKVQILGFDSGESADGSHGGVIGGIAGYISGGAVVDCESKGVSFEKTGGEESFSLCLGGIAGKGNHFENCRVNGSVTAGLDNGFTSNVGGVFGEALPGTGSCTGCVVNGSVSVTGDGWNTCVGGLGGSMQGTTTDPDDLYVEACEFNGTLTYPEDSWHQHKFLGWGTIPGDDVQEDEDLPPEEEEEECYIVAVKEIDTSNFQTKYLPLPDAEVIVKELSGEVLCSGITDENGELKLSNLETGSLRLVRIAVVKKGYADSDYHFLLADAGVHTTYTHKLEPGKIYFRKVIYNEADKIANLLNSLDKVGIPIIDEEAKKVEVSVNWNDLDEENRVVYLANANGQKRAHINDGDSSYVNFAALYDPDEEIYIWAEGTYQGEPVKEKQKLSVLVKDIYIDLEMKQAEQQVGASGEEDEDDHPYFLQGLDLGAGLGAMVPFASEISCRNGILKLEFTWHAGEGKEMPVWKFKGKSHKVDVFIVGTVKIPITDPEGGEWEGGVEFGFNQLPDIEFEETLSAKVTYEENDYPGVFKIEYPFYVPTPIGVAPCYFESSLGTGVSGSLNFHGPQDAAYATGKTTVAGYGSIGLGLGGEIGGEVELKVGGEGEFRPEIALVYESENDEGLSIDAKLQGSISAKALIKAYELKGELKLKLGGFKWDKNGMEWYDITQYFGSDDGHYGGGGAGGGGGGGHLSSLMAEDPTWQTGEWQAVDRAYLENGGGFLENEISFFAFSEDAGSDLRYENIAATADTAMTVEDGNLVLYYTADDGCGGTEGTVANHTALWKTTLSEGSWSEPEIIRGPEYGFSATPHTDGSYVVWVESKETDTLDALLSSTVIRVAKDGQLVATVPTEGYVYDPEISSSADGTSATLIWKANSGVSSESLIGTGTAIYTASYTEEAGLSTPTELADAVEATLLDAGAGVVYKTTDGQLIQNTTTVLSGVGDRYATNGTITASFDEEGVLTIYRGKTEEKTTATGYGRIGVPVLVSDGQTHSLFWLENNCIRYMTGSNGTWHGPLMLTATEGSVSSLKAELVNGVPYISYLQTTIGEDGAEQTDLYTMEIDLNGVDLVFRSLGYDREELLEDGMVRLQGTLYNNGAASADKLLVTVTDEQGNTVYTGTTSRTIEPAAEGRIYVSFAENGAHTYAVTVLPEVGDMDRSDNSMELEVAGGLAEIVETGFQPGADGSPQLQALIRNTGAGALTDVTVEISERDGEILFSKTYGEDSSIPSGSIRQILMDDVQHGVCYEVTVSSGEQVLDSELLIFEDPDTFGAYQINSVSVDEGAALVNVTRNGGGKAKLAAAVYSSNGQFRSIEFLPLVLEVGESETVEIPVTCSESDRVSVYILDSYTLRPLCEAVS